jgi:hypothetical protein
VEVSDAELEALALAADPDAPLPAGAQPLELGAPGSELPAWYMPSATAGAATSSLRRRVVVWSIVGAFAAINAVGMCSTYGVVGFG